MRLLQIRGGDTFSLVEFGQEVPPYAILSHTWGPDGDETTFKDIMNGTGECKAGYSKIRFCAKQAAKDNLQYFWIDTCCIDKSSSAELTEAINSMFRWYRNAAKCYVYLSDISESSVAENNLAFRESRWFKRGWTLQELIAPLSVEFFCSNGQRIGEKASLLPELEEITKIPTPGLQGTTLSDFSVEERLSWTKSRQTKREEDMVYSLLGIFDICMPLIYGEGVKNAFRRLREEIAKVASHGSRSQGIMQAFDITNYEAHLEINTDRYVVDTCQWFLHHNKFYHWRRAADSNVLLVSGDPGCGKSVLASFLVQRFRSLESQRTLPGTVCYFFFKDDDEKSKTATYALCGLLHQLFRANPDLLEHVTRSIDEDGKALTNIVSDPTTLWDIFTKVLADARCGNILYVIDALDECEEHSRDWLLGRLTKLFSSQSSHRSTYHDHSKFLITSRPNLSIEREMGSGSVTRLKAEDETSLIGDDIEVVVKARIADLGWKTRLSRAVQTSLEEYLIKHADRTFLWVSLILADLEKTTRLSTMTLQRILRSIPPTLDGVYEKILSQSTDIGLAKRLLQIVVTAARPLSLREVNVALFITPECRSHDDLDLEPDGTVATTIKALCGLFVRVIDSRVYLVHQTVKEFLCNSSSGRVGSGLWKNTLNLADSHYVLGLSCAQYILLDEFHLGIPEVPALEAQEEKDYKLHDCRLDKYAERYPFIDYAAKHWASHARHCSSQDKLWDLSYQLCDTSSRRFRSWFEVYWRTVLNTDSCPSDWTPLMVASHLNLVPVVKILLSEGSAVCGKDGYGGTPLLCAAENGHSEVVGLLLAAGADVNDESQDGTPLYLAAHGGHEETVRILIKDHPEIHHHGPRGFSALHVAALNGCLGVVRTLLDEYKIVNDSNFLATTPLHAAIKGRSHVVAKCLVEEYDAEIDVFDYAGRTPLHRAITQGDEEMALFLLAHGADVQTQADFDTLDYEDDDRDFGGTALHRAVATSQLHIMEILLRHSLDLTSRDMYESTPLHWAAEVGDEAMFTLLQEHIHLESNDYSDILPTAYYGGNMIIIDMVLRHGGSYSATNPKFGPNLHAAACGGHENVVQFLLEKGVDTDLVGGKYGTALQAAAYQGKVNIVLLLLYRGNADVNIQSGLYGNALQASVLADRGFGSGEEVKEVVKLLLDKGAHVDAEGGMYGSALQAAAYQGNDDIVKLLLDHGARGTLQRRSSRLSSYYL